MDKNIIKAISYNSLVIKAIRFLGLKPLLRKVYYFFYRPKNGILEITSAGVRAKVYVRNSEELRLAESSSSRWGEGPLIEKIILSVKEGDVAYDIGANTGVYSMLLAKAVGNHGKVIAFEPENKSFSNIAENITLNHLINVTVFQKALGLENKKEKLYINSVAGNFSLVQKSPSVDTQNIEIVHGDMFVKDSNLPIPKVIKIDVEGYELLVLKGLKKTISDSRCTLLCCEIHSDLLGPDSEKEILELLQACGFSKISSFKKKFFKPYHIIAEKLSEKAKLLACAYSCLKDPDARFGDGGEGVLGWSMVKQLARFHQMWVLTHFKNRLIIEEKLKENPLEGVEFIYIGLPFGLEFLNKFHGGIQIAAYIWQIKAYFVAKKLHKLHHFEAFQHITYANDWMASFIGAFLPVPYMRGPGGGAHRIPKPFLEEYSFKEKALEKLRSVGQWFFRHDPVFIMGQNKAKAILVCNKEAFDNMPKKWQEKAYFFPVNGVSKKDLDIKAPLKRYDEFVVATAGKLLKLKNFNLAIRAFKKFNDNFSKSKLIIIGDGPEFKNLNDLVLSLGIKDKVEFKKWMKREDFLKVIALADIFIFSSLRDGGGAVVVEAMAEGKPVVCFDIAGPGFHIKEEWGIKIKPENPNQSVEKMARALESLYNNEVLRNELGQKAKKRAEKYYLWDTLGNELQQIYQDKVFRY